MQTYPSGASVTLLDSALPYRPDMQLPMGSVRIQVAKAGHATERRNVLVGPGVNNISVTLRAVTLPAAQSAKLRTPAQG